MKTSSRPRHAARLERLRARLGRDVPSALLVTSLPNIRYLTGFSGSAAAVVVTRREAVFMTDFRYRLQAAREVRACRRVEFSGPAAETVAAEVRRLRVRRLGFEAEHLTVAGHRRLGKQLGKIALVSTRDVVEDLRIVKDAAEIAALRGALRCTRDAYRRGAARLRGRSEGEIALALEAALRRAGAEAAAFAPIVLAGSRAALPHGVPSKRAVAAGDTVIIDFGARFGGYNADVTRTRIVAPGSARARRICRVVDAARRAAIAVVRPGVAARDVDAAARGVIAAAGLEEHFGHGTGHGVGLEVHERPHITARSEERLEPGMVFTVEPGVYLENFGGVRIEDMVLVTGTGCRVLSRAPAGPPGL